MRTFLTIALILTVAVGGLVFAVARIWWAPGAGVPAYVELRFVPSVGWINGITLPPPDTDAGAGSTLVPAPPASWQHPEGRLRLGRRIGSSR
jgi:hypothetical protein